MPYIIPWKKPGRTWGDQHGERWELPRRSWNSLGVPPASSSPMSIQGDSGAEPELLQTQLFKAKPLLLLGLRSYFWFPRPHQQSGLHLQQARGYF